MLLPTELTLIVQHHKWAVNLGMIILVAQHAFYGYASGSTLYPSVGNVRRDVAVFLYVMGGKTQSTRRENGHSVHVRSGAVVLIKGYPHRVGYLIVVCQESSCI